MGDFWKAAALVLVAVVLSLALGKGAPDIRAVLGMAVCCAVGITAMSYLEPVLDLLRELEELGGLENGMLTILLKAVGIALVAEVAAMVCADAGAGSMGRSLQLLASGVIVYLSIPVIRAFLTLIQEIMEPL